MRKASTLVGLTLVALAATSQAQGAVPAAAAPAPPPVDAAVPATESQPARDPRRIELCLSFLPMEVGKLTVPVGAMEATGDASFAYGVGLAFNYRMMAGLSIGLAPQAIFNVKYKVSPSPVPIPTATEYDVMARLAYTAPVVETIALYAEVLPGYSLIAQPGSAAKGFVLGLGGGVVMGLGDRSFANLGVGYQIGFQTVSQASTLSADDRTKYLRVALGGGVRF